MKGVVLGVVLSFSLISAGFSANPKPELVLGVHPYKSVAKLEKHYLPLTELLSRKLNVKYA